MLRGRTRLIGWNVVAWVMAVLFAIAPLEAQAAMSAAAAGPHNHAAATSDHHVASDHEHLSKVTHQHHDDGEQTPPHHGGHDHTKPHSGSCCGTFCHSPLVELPMVSLLQTASVGVGNTLLLVHVAEVDSAGLLRPPRA